MGGPAAGECSECGSPLREGAAFCTECGASSASPTLATGAPPAAAAAAALLHEIKAGGSGDAAAAPTPDAPAPKVGPDKLAAGPAASRTILASVGATGGYSSTRIAGSTRPAPPTTPPPTSGMPTRSDDNGKKKVLAVLAVVAILITAGIVVVAATSGSDHNSVQAGRRSQLDDSQLTSHQTTQTTIAGQSGSSTTVKAHKSKKNSKGGTTTSEAPTSTVKGSKKHGSTSHGSTATTVKGSSPPTTSGGHTSHPGTPPPPSSPPTTKGAPPGHLNVGAGSIALTGYAPSYHLTLSNSGGSALRWNASISGVNHGSVSPSSGQISAGGVTSVTVSWNGSGTTEGTGGGSLAIVVNSSASGSTTLPVSTDSRQPDTIDYVGWNTASHCTASSRVQFAVHFKAGAGATPTYSTHVQVDLVGQASGFWVPASIILVKNPSPDPKQVWVAQLRHAVSGSIDFTVTATDGAGQVGTGTFHLAC